MLGGDLHELLGYRVPGDHSRQTRSYDMAEQALAGSGSVRVLDLGCGAGDSVDFFRGIDPEVAWVGVDIAESPEVSGRTRDDAEFHTFDGLTLPFEDASFDLVFCQHVLEHVRDLPRLMAETARVLVPGGRLAGSTSLLEPFHSRSTANPTPYGLTLVLEEAGMEVEAVRPGIDGVTLTLNQGLRGPGFMRRFWTTESPLNRAIGLYGRAKRFDAAQVNAAKLEFCGHYAFLARRVG